MAAVQPLCRDQRRSLIGAREPIKKLKTQTAKSVNIDGAIVGLLYDLLNSAAAGSLRILGT